MPGGHGRRAEDEVVAGGAADGERHERTQVNGAPRGLLVAQQQHDAVVAARLDVADGGHVAGSEGHARRADAVDEDAVGGAVVLDVAGAALKQERPVELRDDAGGRGELDVVLRSRAKGDVLLVELEQVDLEEHMAALDHREVERRHAVEERAVVQKCRAGVARRPLPVHGRSPPYFFRLPAPVLSCSRADAGLQMYVLTCDDAHRRAQGATDRFQSEHRYIARFQNLVAQHWKVFRSPTRGDEL